MFSELFSQADRIEIFTDFDNTPVIGKFIGSDSSFLFISDAGNCIQAISLSHLLCCRTTPVSEQTKFATASVAAGGIETGYMSSADVNDNDAQGLTSPEAEKFILTEHSDSPASSDTAIADDADGIASVPILTGPKILGKIDLSAIKTRKKNRFATYKADGDNERFETGHNIDQRHDWNKEDDIWHMYPKPLGIVKRTGAKFGFITNQEGEDLCYQSYNALDKLMPGDKVIFVTYEHPRGTQARSVARVRSVGALIKKIERMDEVRDKMRIEDLARLIKDSFPDNQVVESALEDHFIVTDETVEDTFEKQTEIRKPSANEFKRIIKRMASTMLPVNYPLYRIKMAEMIENKKNSSDPYERNQVYDLYTSLIHNSFGREERARFIEEAVDYYSALGENVKAEYFSRLSYAGLDKSVKAESPASTESSEIDSADVLTVIETSETEPSESTDPMTAELESTDSESTVPESTVPESIISEPTDLPESSDSKDMTESFADKDAATSNPSVEE